MSKQNVNDWADKFGTRLEIGQTVAAAKGKNLIVGEIKWFSQHSVCIGDLDIEGNEKNVFVLYAEGPYRNRKQSKFFVIS